MSLDDRLEKGASILFSDDPLTNMVARGFGRGLTSLGAAAKTGLQKLRRVDNFSESETFKETPQREMSDVTTDTNWTWLKDVLSNIADDISSIKTHLIEQDKDIDQQGSLEKLQLIEDSIENRDDRPRLTTTKDGDKEDESSTSRFGLLGTVLSKIMTMISGIFSSFMSLSKMFSRLPILLSGLSLIFAKVGAVLASAYAALKLAQKIAPTANNYLSERTENVGTRLMTLGDQLSWMKSKFSGEENYTSQYENLFSQESPENSVSNTGVLDAANELLDSNYKEKRERTNKNLRIQAELRAKAALSQDIKSREEQLQSLENVPDMVAPDGKISSNSASIRRQKLSEEIKELKDKKQQFEKYISAKSEAGLEGRWIESVSDQNTGEIINNPLISVEKSQSVLKESNDRLKKSVDSLNDTMKKFVETDSTAELITDYNTANTQSKNLNPAFITKTQAISKKLGIKPEWLMAAMDFETGGTFSPGKKNMAGTSGTGLIQFMEKTATSLGTSTAELAKMSQIQQLDYVEKFLKPNAKRIKSPEDLYMAILRPDAIGKSNEHILFRRGDNSYGPNRGLDKNRDGIVTKLEAASPVMAKIDKYSTQVVPKVIPDIITDYTKTTQTKVIPVAMQQPIMTQNAGSSGPMSPITKTIDDITMPGTIRDCFREM